MAFGSFEHKKKISAEINMVPLIDVMLVLLVIFIITAPLVSQPIKLQLPQTVVLKSDALQAPQPILIAINAQQAIFINGKAVNNAALQDELMSLEQESDAANQTVHLHIDAAVPYEQVAQLLAHLSKVGLTQIGFVSIPDQGNKE